ncbi:MAG TPA: biotin--[acetyl-CoA-carboxylase] ligase [bacterium]|nr:biotin--[acetyl-CoA-carboxylase] ligase [bacterium]
MPALGNEIIRLEEVASTNSLVLERPAYLERHGLVVVARHQTGGRGRMGRRWASLPGRQLQFSVVLHPPFPTADFPAVALLAGLAVAQACEEELGVRPDLKWPNDVMLVGRKVCGILVEGSSGAGGRPRLVVGIGINCQGDPGDFPAELQAHLTTLAHETSRPVDPEALLQTVLERLEALLERLAAGDKAAMLEQWRGYGLLGEGQRVRFTTQQGPREGIPEGLTPEGYLIVRLPDGSAVIQVSGELEWMM